MSGYKVFPAWAKYLIVACGAFFLGKLLFEGTKAQKSAIVDEMLVERVTNGRIYNDDVFINATPRNSTVINLTDVTSLDRNQEIQTSQIDDSGNSYSQSNVQSKSAKKITVKAGEPYVITQMNDDDRKKKVKRLVAPQNSGKSQNE